MGEISIQVRGLSGTTTVSLDNENGDVSVADVRQAAGLAESLVLRLNGERVDDEESTFVGEDDVLVSTAPEAKHG